MRAVLLFAVVLTLPCWARAEAGTFEIVEMKLTSAIENKMPVDEKGDFATGERAWLWLNLKPASETAAIRCRWSLNGNPVWTMDPKPVQLGRTWYYKTFDLPGEWQVEILDDSDTVLKTATLNVSGEAIAVAAPSEAAASASGTPSESAASAPGTPSESAHVEVVELKLAAQIEDRDPVSPAAAFDAGEKVFSWVKLNVKEPETQIKMRWYVGDTAVYTSDPVTVKESPGYRTWLFKTVDQAGAWKVEILDADEKTVAAESFTVR